MKDILDAGMDDDRSSYRIKVSVKNNLLLSAIEDAGYKSAAEFARSAGLRETDVSALVSLRSAPISKHGEFTLTAQKIMEALGAAPSDLWTNEQLNMSLSRSTRDYCLNGRTVLSILGGNAPKLEGTVFEQNDQPEEHVYEQDLKAIIEQSLDQCTPRQAKVLRLRFGIGGKEHTLAEVAAVFDVTRDRIRQIELQAIRKLQDIAWKDGALKDLRVEEYGAASLKRKYFWDDFDDRVQAHQNQNVSQGDGDELS